MLLLQLSIESATMQLLGSAETSPLEWTLTEHQL